MWVVQVEPMSGRKYFVHRQTLVVADKEPTPDVQVPNPTAPYADWKVFVDGPTCKPYYYNLGTHQARWDNPVGPTQELESDRPLTLVPATAHQPPPLRTRLAAAAIDAAVACSVGVTCGGIMWYELGHPFYGQVGGLLCAAVAAVVRDCTVDAGTRSVGKRRMGLEIVRNDGRMSGRINNVLRGLIQGLCLAGDATLVTLIYVPLLTPLELGVAALREDRRRLSDVLATTRVIREQPDRAQRLLEFRQHLLAGDLETPKWRVKQPAAAATAAASADESLARPNAEGAAQPRAEPAAPLSSGQASR